MEKEISIDLLKLLNDKQLKELDSKLYGENTSESRKNKVTIRLLKKLNQKKYDEYNTEKKQKRKGTRWE